MPRESYDLIVVGDELPGLVAATLCARRGMRVLYGQIAPRLPAYSLGGIKLPVEPLLLGLRELLAVDGARADIQLPVAYGVQA